MLYSLEMTKWHFKWMSVFYLYQEIGVSPHPVERADSPLLQHTGGPRCYAAVGRGGVPSPPAESPPRWGEASRRAAHGPQIPAPNPAGKWYTVRNPERSL